ncbi:MAG TPA: serine hydrolase [bacterium]
MDHLRSRILTEIAAYPDATVAVAYTHLGSGQTLFINEQAMMHAASTMKVPVMIEVFKQAEAGKFQLTDSLLVRNEFKSIVDGSLFAMNIDDDSDESIYYRVGQKMTIADLAYQMITVSSNLATNLLIELVSAKKVMVTMKEIGAQDIQVLRGVEDIKAYRAGKNNVTNARDLMLVMAAIARKQVVSPAACDQMLEILFSQTFRDKIPRLLPAETKVANKDGSITEIEHDAAIVFPKDSQPYVIVVLTEGIKDSEAANNLIAKISKLIFDFQSPSAN